MPSSAHLDKILSLISAVRDDEEKLQHILAFLESEILPGIEEAKIKIPEKYEALVHAIADSLSAGMICHLNMDSLEVVDFPANVDAEEWEGVTGEKLEPLYLQWKNVVSFEPLDSSESFRIMEDFVMQMTDIRAQGTLTDILS